MDDDDSKLREELANQPYRTASGSAAGRMDP